MEKTEVSKQVHTDTPLLGYTKIRNTDISVSALIAVSKEEKHIHRKVNATPSLLFSKGEPHSHHLLSFVQKSGVLPISRAYHIVISIDS